MRAPKVSSAPPPAAPKPPGRAPKWRSSPPRRSFSSPIISAARRCSPVRSRRSAKSMARWSTSRTSRARRAPSRARGSRRRRPQSAHGRTARRRQVDVGRAAADHPAAADAGGTAGSLDDRLGGGRDRGRRAHQSPPVPRPASFRQHAGAGWRRIARAAGRNFTRPSRRALPRRVARVQAAGPRFAASAARDRGGRHRAGQPSRDLSRFMLVAAMNPCRCGRASEPGFACKRGANARCAAEYQGRLSGPLIDRIDLHIEVPAVTAADLILPPPAEGSREVAARVARARAMQAERYAAVGLPQVRTNAAAQGPLLEEAARPDAGGLALLRDAADAMRLSARGYHRVLRVARTLADLDGAEKVGRVHFAEALSYRALSTRCAARREREVPSQPSQR